METVGVLPHAVEPVEWFVVFHRKSTTRWLSWAACGRFKHVSAFAYYPGFKVWLLYDVHIAGTALIMLSHERAKETLAAYVDGCTVVKIAREPRPFGFSLNARLGFYCVSAIKNLLGLRCVALRPDALYAHVLRCGGVIVHGQNAGYSDRSESCDRAAAGAERSRLVAAE